MTDRSVATRRRLSLFRGVTAPAPAPAASGVDIQMLLDVRQGLTAPQKWLSPKYFYDHRGSELFERITRLPEYYPTRIERAILEAWMPELIRRLGTRTLVELGAGNAEKSRVILDAMRQAGSADAFVPVDVSGDFLQRTAARIGEEYPGLQVAPVVADIDAAVRLPHALLRPMLIAFLGSSIGNFSLPAAIRLLRRTRELARPADRLLLGVDLRKAKAVVEAAYNDAEGVTAQFNRNVLLVLNRELAADFFPELFEHRAFYRPGMHRIEMHLVSRIEQVVTIPGVGRVQFRKGETIRTEISCKYDRSTVRRMLRYAGFELDDWQTDPRRQFALVLGRPLP